MSSRQYVPVSPFHELEAPGLPIKRWRGSSRGERGARRRERSSSVETT
jgi:hypothetical protein